MYFIIFVKACEVLKYILIVINCNVYSSEHLGPCVLAQFMDKILPL